MSNSVFEAPVREGPEMRGGSVVRPRTLGRLLHTLDLTRTADSHSPLCPLSRPIVRLAPSSA